MFFLVGVIYDRAHHRNLDNFRGLYEPMPLYGGISAIIFFAAMGLPGMCGFVGEFMVVLATWNFSKVFAVLAALTVVITAAYILWTIQRVYLGTNPAYKDYKDMTPARTRCASCRWWCLSVAPGRVSRLSVAVVDGAERDRAGEIAGDFGRAVTKGRLRLGDVRLDDNRVAKPQAAKPETMQCSRPSTPAT